MDDKYPSPIEVADRTFTVPAAFSWGRPPGTAYSEERAAWIRSKLAEKLRYKAGWDYAKRMIELGRKGDIHSVRAAELARKRDGA